MHTGPSQRSSRFTLLPFPSLLALAIAATASAQTPASPVPPSQIPDPFSNPTAPQSTPGHADAPIHIIHPTLNKADHSVSLPAAFWNQHMTSWVEVALCGRPSDFLHETVVSVTTTKSILTQAMRDVGFHDADAWVDTIHNFPRLRGDRFLIILDVTRNGKHERYSLDELLSYEGWNVSTGPYGWMFKGDPEHAAASQPAPANPLTGQPADDDRSKIVHDDPQVAIVYKGIQHMSQSFADHPLAYDDWIYPMMRYGRNYKLLPPAVYDSNGGVPVTLTLKKVNEEELLTESASLWHDKAAAAHILQQLPTARDLDAAKSDFWTLRQKYRDATSPPPESETDRAALLVAQIEKDYAELDAAWADWSCDHLALETTDPKERSDTRHYADLWKAHMDLERTAAQQRYRARKAELAEKSAATDHATLQKLRGEEIIANSAALLADNTQPAAYWKSVQQSLDPKNDPRADWIKHVNAAVALADARNQQALAGQDYGKRLQENAPPDQLTSAQNAYQHALKQTFIAQTRLDLIDTNFEISKRQGMTDDPDLPTLLKKRDTLEKNLKAAGATTRP